MKRAVILVSALFILTSCFWSSSDSNSWGGLKKHEWEWYSIDVPVSWNDLTNNTSVVPTPKYWEVSLAMSATEMRLGFANNIVILKQKLTKPALSREYSYLNNAWASKNYTDYLKLESKDIEFQDEWKSMMYIFEAKYNKWTPMLKFMQVGRVCAWDVWYLLTIALSLDVKASWKYQEILESFTCEEKI